MSKRVLVVDDEPNIVMSLEFLMRRANQRQTATFQEGMASAPPPFRAQCAG